MIDTKLIIAIVFIIGFCSWFICLVIDGLKEHRERKTIMQAIEDEYNEEKGKENDLYEM